MRLGSNLSLAAWLVVAVGALAASSRLARADLAPGPPAPVATPPAASVDPAPSAQPAAGASVPAAPTPQDDIVVARVGGLPITAARLHRRMAQTPVFQLAALGKTPEEIRRRFLETVLVPELLHVKEAEARGIGERPEVAERVRGVLRGALLTELRREASEDGVTEDEVKAYYQANADKFVAPQKLALWRILLGSEADAKALVAELGASPDPKRWAEIARERSLDESTKQRGGNLGFVEPDGSTGQRGVKVDTALVRAAEGVPDGQLVPTPVKEGDRFAVVWKRQTLRAVTRPLDAERPAIRQLLGQERVQSRVMTLLTSLRSDRVREQHPEVVDGIAIDAQGELSRALRPGALPRARRVGRPQPEPGPDGLR